MDRSQSFDTESVLTSTYSDHRSYQDRNLQNGLIAIQNHEENLSKAMERAQLVRNIGTISSEKHIIDPHTEVHDRILPQNLFRNSYSISMVDDGLGDTLTSMQSDDDAETTQSKCMMVSIVLSDEVQQLKEISENELYGSIEMFGQQQQIDSNTATIGSDEFHFKDGQREVALGNFLPLLQNVYNLCKRCNFVVLNIVQQLSQSSLPSSSPSSSMDALFYRTCFDPLYTTLCDALAILIKFDTLIRRNDALNDCWSYYKAMITQARNSSESFQLDENVLSEFEKMLVLIDTKLFTHELFRTCIDQNFEVIYDEGLEIQIASHYSGSSGLRDVEVSNNGIFLQKMVNTVEKFVEKILTSSDMINISVSDKENLIGIYGLYALFRQLSFSSVAPDKKLYKLLWKVQKVVPFVPFGMNCLWNLSNFMMKEAYLDEPKLDPISPPENIGSFMDSFDGEFAAKAEKFTHQAAQWSINYLENFDMFIKANTRDSGTLSKQMDTYLQMMHRGVTLITGINNYIQFCLSVHIETSRPFSRRLITSLSSLIEAKEMLLDYIMQYKKFMEESFGAILRKLSRQVLNFLSDFESKTNLSQIPVEILNLLKYNISTLENILEGSNRLNLVRMFAVKSLVHGIITICGTLQDKFNQKLITGDSVLRLMKYIQKLEFITKFSHQIRSSDSKFLYFHLTLLDPLMSELFSKISIKNSHRLKYLVRAFCGSVAALPYYLRMENYIINVHVDINNDKTKKLSVNFISRVRDYILSILRTSVIQPLCKTIETDLRYHTHKATVNGESSVKSLDNMRPWKSWLSLDPLDVLGIQFSITGELRHYLDMSFYDLTTLAIHDWRTYSEMRAVTKERFTLSLMENFLPMGSLDQGLDVLQIMRNIHIFVSRFTYNLNSQEFVEFKPDQTKHVNTIKTESIAASIRQHGLGILNTAVNFTYQFLAKKFDQFSLFLNDEYIRAYLSKEKRWYKKNKLNPEINSTYPYDRAAKFTKDIRKLGLSSNGRSYLDLFRILLMEIGNALGYVRMVRSAAMIYCADAVKFVNDIEKDITFAENIKDAFKSSRSSNGNIEEQTSKSAGILDLVIETLIKNFTEGNNYFKVLVKVFQEVLESHDHLNDFYILVPALTISWMESSLAAKDNMYKISNKSGQHRDIHYVDDGVAMGIAYCLAVLKQNKKWQSLHWQDAVTDKHNTDQKRITDELNTQNEKLKKINDEKSKRKSIFNMFSSSGDKNGNDDSDMPEQYEEKSTIEIGQRKLEAQRREMSQLFYSMKGASIFFRLDAS